MSDVRAGATSGAHIALYSLAGVVTTAVVCGAVTAEFGLHRIVTGLVIGVFAGIAVSAWLFHSDRTVLGDDAITVRTLGKRTRIDWERIGTVRFAWPEGSERWLLTADLNTADLDRRADKASTVLLLATAPVEGPMANPYELRKREQLKAILHVLQTKNIRVIFAPGIASLLDKHWHIAAPGV